MGLWVPLKIKVGAKEEKLNGGGRRGKRVAQFLNSKDILLLSSEVLSGKLTIWLSGLVYIRNGIPIHQGCATTYGGSQFRRAWGSSHNQEPTSGHPDAPELKLRDEERYGHQA